MNNKKMNKSPSKHTNTENVQSPLNQKQRLWWKEWHLFLKLISKESPDFAFKFHLSGEKQEKWTETQLHDHNHTTVQTQHRTTTDLLFNQVKIKSVEVYTIFTDFKNKKNWVMQKVFKKKWGKQHRHSLIWTKFYYINTLSRGNLLCPNEFRVILWEPTNVKLLERWALRPGRVAAITDRK